MTGSSAWGGPSAHSVALTAEVLTLTFSEGRRRRSRLSFGPQRAFTTDLRTVYVPWPAPIPSVRAVSCGIALQVAPTKEAVAVLPLHRLNPRDLRALGWVEGLAAYGWVVQRWPGLAADLEALLPGMTPGDPESDGPALLAMARSEFSKGPRLAEIPALFGRLGGLHPPSMSRFSARRSSSRLPFTRARLNMGSKRIPIVSPNSNGSANSFTSLEQDRDTDVVSIDEKVGLPYPEWDVHQLRYRPNFVTVLERYLPPFGGGRVEIPSEVAHWFRRSPDRAWLPRLEDGTELDVDAFVDEHIRSVMGEVTDGRVYATVGTGHRDIATAILLDGSASLHSSGGRDFALELTCADALTAALAEGREPHAVYAFSGESRQRVDVKVLRRYHDRANCRPTAAKLRPDGYTRLGAPLRHVTRRLLETPARRRILLSIGDGLPSDEGYEGRYAEADVAKAVEEAAAEGIIVFHIGVGQVRDDPLEAMFGRDRCLRVRRAHDLAPALGAIYEELRDQ